MKESNIVQLVIKENYKRERHSPIRTLLKLTGNSKSKNKISVEKMKNQTSEDINNSIISKGSSTLNINQNYKNLNISKDKKTIDYGNKENINYNSQKNIILQKISDSNNIVKNNNNITVNRSNNYSNYFFRKNEQNINKKKFNKNNRYKRLKFERNDKNNYRKSQKNIITYDNNNTKNKIKNDFNIKLEKINKELKLINNNRNYKTNANITFFNSRLQISCKKERKKENIYSTKVYINQQINTIQPKENEGNISNRTSSCINFYNKYLRNNIIKFINNKKEENSLINNNINKNIFTIGKYIYSSNEINTPFSSINNDNNSNLLKNDLKTKNSFLNQNLSDISEIKKENKNYISNNLINKQNILNNIVYSPKKGIHRVHSQNYVKRKDHSIIIKDKNKANINQAVKDLNNNYIYTKKNDLSKPKKRKSEEQTKKYGIIEISGSSILKKHNSKNDKQMEQKIYNIKTVINKDDINHFNEEKYQLEPHIYPDIQINLKKNKNLRKNNSVNVVNNSNFCEIEVGKNNIEEKNDIKPNNSNFSKYKINNQLSNKNLNKNIFASNNSFKNISNFSNLSNINKTNVHSNSNTSFITIPDSNYNSCLNSLDITNKNLKTSLSNRMILIDDLYYILVYEEKIKDIFNSLLIENKNSYISYYCFELINFFYNYSVNKCIQNILLDKIDLKNLNICNNNTLLAIILLYELSFHKNCFNNLQILIKEILKLIYSNLILVIRQSNSILESLELQEKNNSYELYDIMNNILNKYINNKELYINDNEYILLNHNNKQSYEEKIYSNLNFIIRNIHAIINNIVNIQNYEYILNIFNKINNISYEEIIIFFREKILRVNIFNSSLLSSFILDNNLQNQKKGVNIPYISNINKRKYTLILSLDDTIVHFKTSSFANNKGVVQIRPGLMKFFQNIKNFYEIIIFSSGNKKYSDAIIDSIDEKNKYIDYRLYQENCIIINNEFIKDLSRIGRPIDKMIIIDNIPQNYRLQKENGINIKSFYGDNPNDKILNYLGQILIKISHDGGDTRQGIKKYWNEIIFKISSSIFNNYCN